MQSKMVIALILSCLVLVAVADDSDSSFLGCFSDWNRCTEWRLQNLHFYIKC